MGNRFWNILFRKDESPIYRAACTQLGQMESSIKDLSGKIDLSTERMTKLYPDDPKSPRVLRITENPDTIIIHYPKNSSPYLHRDSRQKFCTLLKGELFLIKDGEQVKLNRKFKIDANQKMIPFTKSSDCIAFIEFDKNSFWDNVC